MTYSGANHARTARESLGKALEALQQDPNIPDDVLAVAQNIAQAVGALFQAERAPSEPEGKGFIRQALGSLSQTLALLQDVRGQHRGIEIATEAIAGVMGVLYPLTNVPTHAPPPGQAAPAPVAVPAAAPVPLTPASGFATTQPAPHVAPALAAAPPPASLGFGQQPAHGESAFAQASHQPAPVHQHAPAQPVFGQPAPGQPSAFGQPSSSAFGQPTPAQPSAFAQAAPAAAAAQPAASAAPAPQAGGPRHTLEANIGATTESNFYVGFSGEIAEGGVFVATYESMPKGAPVRVLVTLPGGFEFQVDGHVRFVRDPMDFSSDSEPGMGVQFDNLTADARQLVLRFVQKRAPIFFDD